ncbi:hypothetical protein, partial [Streptomyces sp. NPDC006324]|uniref:hypothetical protein n=1 Tax=Streptomyces sp. NPDC006324 TaxID=3156751 RepID=UPI0033A1912E
DRCGEPITAGEGYPSSPPSSATRSPARSRPPGGDPLLHFPYERSPMKDPSAVAVCVCGFAVAGPCSYRQDLPLAQVLRELR